MNQSASEILHNLYQSWNGQIPNNMMQSGTLLAVIQAYCDDPTIDAAKEMQNLIFFLTYFNFSRAFIHKEIENPHTIRKSSAVAELRNAANSLSSDNPNVALTVHDDRDKLLEDMKQEDPLIMDLSKPENIKKLADRDLLSHVLDLAAAALDSLTQEQVTPPFARMGLLSALNVDPENLKHHGGAHDRDKAMRAFLVRELDRRTPECVNNRYATIRELASLAGVTLSKTYPRSLLLKGKT